jgi:Helix-turn-helix of DDE superfamily endonuclease
MPSYEEVTQRAGSLQALPGLTDAEFQALLPHFEQAFVTHMHARTIDGHPRTSRRSSTYDTCPLPTLADKLLFILTYLKQNPIQEVQGQLFGMSQSNANTWIHVLHPVLNQALADQELLPARTAAAFAAMFETHATDGGSTTPLFGKHSGGERLKVTESDRPVPFFRLRFGLFLMPQDHGPYQSSAISPGTPPYSWYTRGALPISTPSRRTLRILGTSARGLEDRP